MLTPRQTPIATPILQLNSILIKLHQQISSKLIDRLVRRNTQSILASDCFLDIEMCNCPHYSVFCEPEPPGSPSSAFLNTGLAIMQSSSCFNVQQNGKTNILRTVNGAFPIAFTFKR